jgi:hypothetical protein
MMSAVGPGGNEGEWRRLAQPVLVLRDSVRWSKLLFLRWLALPAMLALRIARLGSGRARIALFALAVVGLTLSTIVLQLDRVLSEMHLPGAVGGGMAQLGDTGVARGWADYARADALPTDPREIAWWFLGLDVAFVLVYTTLLALVAVMLADALPRVQGETAPADTRSRRATLAGALLLTPALGLADLLENAAQWHAVHTGGRAPTLQALSLSKWILLAAVVAPIALAAIGLARHEKRAQTRGLFATLAVTRFQVVALAVFAGLLFLPVAGPQTADTILRWNAGELANPVWGAMALTLLLGVTLFTTSRECATARDRARDPIGLRKFTVPGALLLTGGGILWWQEGEGQGLVVMGGLLLGTAILSLPLERTSLDRDAADREGTALVPALLAVGPLLLLGLATLAATAGQLALYGPQAQGRWAFLAIFAVVVVLSTILAFAFAHDRDARLLGWAGAIVGGLAALVTTALIYVNPWEAADLVGAVGAVSAFLILVAWIGWRFVAIERKYAPPAALAVANFHRLPILLLLLAGLVGAAVLDQTGDHTIRTDKAGPPAESVTLATAFERWSRSNLPERMAEGRARSRASQLREAVPLVFVAAAGGGIRAAYWTARVLRCVVEWRGPPARSCGSPATTAAPADRFGQPLFAASGASGGSLGFASYVAGLGAERQDGDWVRQRLGDDYLAPMVAWLLFADLPKAVAGLHGGPDRGEVLERAWERSWNDPDGGLPDIWPDSSGPLDAGLRASWHGGSDAPLLLLNGTSVHDDCRLRASVLDADVEDPRDPVTANCYTQSRFDTAVAAGSPRRDWALPATHDLDDYLTCAGKPPKDVRLSTAALLSARFPFVSPSGRIEGCGDEDTVHVVDGGYVDNSGASTAVELWRHLERRVNRHNAKPGTTCIVPVFLQIDNDYTREDAPGARKRPYEPFVPLQVFANVRDGNGADARQAAALEFHRPAFGPRRRAVTDAGTVHRYAHVFPRAHAGVRAPLGWALSEPSMESLDTQVGRAQPLERIRSWFDPGLRCEPAR